MKWTLNFGSPLKYEEMNKRTAHSSGPGHVFSTDWKRCAGSLIKFVVYLLVASKWSCSLHDLASSVTFHSKDSELHDIAWRGLHLIKVWVEVCLDLEGKFSLKLDPSQNPAQARSCFGATQGGLGLLRRPEESNRIQSPRSVFQRQVNHEPRTQTKERK